MFQTTRIRLALWYTAVTAFLLVIFALSIYVYFYNTLLARIDDTLKHVIEVVEPSLIITRPLQGEDKYEVNLQKSFHQHPLATNQIEEDHIDLEWFSADGQLLWQTSDKPLAIPLSSHPGGKTIRISSDYLLRQITKEVERNGHTLGYLRVSHPLFDIIKPIRQLIFDLTVGIILLVVAVASTGWWLSGIAIQPVKDSYQRLKQFTADVSHELRNPLATIKANIQSLLSSPSPDLNIQIQSLKTVDRLIDRINNLVNDLLFLARHDSGISNSDFSSIPLDSLLLEVVEDQKIIAKQNQTEIDLIIQEMPLCTDYSGETFTILGEWGQLYRLFTNLVSNSIIHGRGLEKQKDKLTVKVILSCHKRQGKLFYQVEVKDDGVGIPTSLIPHLFERFSRGEKARFHPDSSHYSTGLGLAIAKAIVETHHGKIRVESRENQGTNFIVTLPAYLDKISSR
ncbi:MAG: HAMP domain-containing histidine kinase [Geminocystis sp.]|nr:HAMP domain-containing histidine kinase [Geminocystis sp.]MCS7147495.1 HAMP domain-containing histidine kinase [Geminocystis sp.]MDW8115188.1 HAMP domain-containing sensor histidine kinase [Geminocystis sp.]MDW8464457.1 HAMP domain-containing sensor histidine kinase [Geminocystis sp.]